MYKVVSLFAGCGGCDQGITGDCVFNQKDMNDFRLNLRMQWILTKKH